MSIFFRAGLALATAASSATAEDGCHVFEKAEMGVPFRITLYAGSMETAKAAADAAFARIATLNAVMSDYEDDSELVQLSRSSGSGRAVPVSAELWPVLERAQSLAAETDGAFDITCGPLTSVWRRARRKQELPSPALIAEMRARSGWRNLQLDAENRTALLQMPQMRLDLGAIAKGRACDAALVVLRQRGFRSAMVVGGGDTVCGDPPPGRKGWRIEVAPHDASSKAGGNHARMIVEISNRAIATSGDAFQRLELAGHRYSHILDPRTGEPMTDHNLVTVIAEDGMTADSLSTTLAILGPEKGKFMAQRWKIDARWQRQPGPALELTETAGWSRWVVRP